ncbi:hypothetical protein QE152_g38459 [Popillia japonica]|uniref:Uncharacterized protein n=1 Tax=Popillia japonica TaxID=7064 RepID=A0AAW1HXP0_POPJA
MESKNVVLLLEDDDFTEKFFDSSSSSEDDDFTEKFFDSSSSSEDDIEEAAEIIFKKHHTSERVCIRNYDEVIHNYSDAEFIKHFRLNRSVVQELIGRYTI